MQQVFKCYLVSHLAQFHGLVGFRVPTSPCPEPRTRPLRRAICALIPLICFVKELDGCKHSSLQPSDTRHREQNKVSEVTWKQTGVRSQKSLSRAGPQRLHSARILILRVTKPPLTIHSLIYDHTPTHRRKHALMCIFAQSVRSLVKDEKKKTLEARCL